MFRTASTTAALVVGLAIVGAVAGPSWDPENLTDPIVSESPDTAIRSAQPTAPVGTYDVLSTPTVVDLGETEVDAIVRTPVGVAGEVPGVVFIHGAGTRQAETAFVRQATDLASAGVATIVPAKRLDNYSTRHRDYEDMATDYAASVEALRGVDGVDAERVGLYAESEGTWVAPVMATRDPGIAFVAMISAPVVPPRSQAAFAVDNYLRHTGVPSGVFRAIPRAVGMEMPGGGFEYADFDVRPFLAQITQPVLVVYGTADASMPTVQGAQEILDVLAAHGNEDVVVRYYADANHGIKVDDTLVPAFVDDLTSWVLGMPSTARALPQVAGAAPTQSYLAAEVPQVHWFGSGDVVIGVAIGAGVLMLVGPVLWGAALLLRRRPAASVARTLRLPVVALCVATVLTTVALVWYLVMVSRLALEYEQDPWLVQGGWLGVRVLGIVAAVFGAMVIDGLREARLERRSGGVGTAVAARGLLGRATLWGALLGAALLFVLLAYWGVFQLGI